MRNNIHNGVKKSFGKGRTKDKQIQAQMKKVFAALYRQPKTMLMVADETGILRANICRYVARWRKSKCIDVIKVGKCKITRYKANYYTTNPKLFPKAKQLKMFDL